MRKLRLIEFCDTDSYTKTSQHLENFLAWVFLDSVSASPFCIKSSPEIIWLSEFQISVLSTDQYPSGDSEVELAPDMVTLVEF